MARPSIPRSAGGVAVLIVTHLVLAVAVLCMFDSNAAAQPLNDRLDRDAFLDGLEDYGLDELLDYYVETSGENDPIEAALARIAHARAELMTADSSDIAAGEPTRIELIDHLLERRRALIERFDSDPRYPLWQADLAFDLLMIALEEDGLDMVVEFGVASEEERDRFRALAHEALLAADEAIVTIADLILEIEEDPNFGGDMALQQRRRRLMNVEQRQRAPFLFETARYFNAIATSEGAGGGVQDDTEKASDSEIFVSVAEGAATVIAELDEPWRARMRLIEGLSLARAGRADEAEQRLNQIVTAPADDVNVMIRFRAKLGRVLATGLAEGPNAALESLDGLSHDPAVASDPFQSLIVADQGYRWRRRMAQGGHGDWAAELRALDAYEQFVENNRLPLSRAEREAIVTDRVVRVIPADIPADDLPPRLALAHAQRLLRDAATRGEGIKRIESILDRAGRDDPARPRALHAVAMARLESGEALRAAERWLELAQMHPTSDLAGEAVKNAVLIAWSEHVEAPENEAAAALFDDASRLLIDSFPAADEFDRWAYARGVFAASKDDVAEAIDSFELVPPGSAHQVDALYQIARLRLQAAESAAAHREAVEAIEKALAAVAHALADDDESVATGLGDEGRAADLRYMQAALHLLAARQRRALGEHEVAIETLRRLEADSTAPSELVTQAIALRLELQQSLGQDELIARELGELAKESPERAWPVLLRAIDSNYERALGFEIEGRYDEAARHSLDRLIPLAELAMNHASSVAQGEEAAHVQTRLAEGYRLARQYEKAIVQFEAAARRQPDSALVSVGRAESLYQLARHEDAIRLFAQVASSLRDERNWMYWLAELRSLQILDAASRNTDEIFPRIQRLRRLDPDLGGERFAGQFRALEIDHRP